MTPAPVIWLMTVLETPEEAAPMMALTPWPSRADVDWVAISVLVSPESRWVTRNRLAEDTAGVVDFLDAEVNARDFGRAKERQRSGGGQQRSDFQRRWVVVDGCCRHAAGP
jgi:hypothetical protein